LGPIEISDEQFKDYFFFKIPHKDGLDLRVGNPLSKDFKKQFKDGILDSFQSNYANLLLNYEASMNYWVNNEKRIRCQLVVWLPTKISNSNNRLFGAILPRTIVAGTITRRAVEPTWLTASNYKKDRIGSELKAMINAPEGYHFVGADVDSQELWIASLIGDSHFDGIHGATPIGWMNLQGKKSDGTDMHSRTAKIIGISRDHAKVINYGRIYGAGIKYAEQLLIQFNPTLKQEEAKEKAKIMYETTKGKKSKVTFKRDKYTPNQKWIGGTESEMFNELEAIAYSRSPKTPVLGSSITRCLEPDFVSDAVCSSRL
jgi:DNA polymerase gamma 1